MASGHVSLQRGPRKMQILKAIEAFRTEHRYGPTLAEIARLVGVTRVTVYEHVQAMRAAGILTQPGKRAYRSLDVCGVPEASASGNCLGVAVLLGEARAKLIQARAMALNYGGPAMAREYDGIIAGITAAVGDPRKTRAGGKGPEA